MSAAAELGVSAFMTLHIRDYLPLLKVAITEAKTACPGEAVDDLEQAAIGVFTTSSEMLQEQGLAIRRFLKLSGSELPPATRKKLEICLNETELAYVGWRRWLALMKRRRNDIN